MSFLADTTVEAIIAEERSKQHNVLANKLAKAMNGMGNGVRHIKSTSEESVHRGRDFIAEIQPQRRLDELVLPEPIRTTCLQLIEEHYRADLLRSYRLEPRHHVLLIGPPGHGKTTLAEGRRREHNIAFEAQKGSRFYIAAGSLSASSPRCRAASGW